LLNPGTFPRGHRLYVRNNFIGSKLSVGGTPYIGTLPVILTKTATAYDGGGYNFIANPYNSTIDFDLLTKGGSVNNAFFIYANANYGYYQGVGGSTEGVALNLGSNLIASMQGFFVRALAGPDVNRTLTFNENAKVANNTASFYRSGPVVDRLRIKVRDNANHSDEAVIRFRSAATDGIDANIDGSSFRGDWLNISSVVGTSTADVNSLPLLTGRKSVFLDLFTYNTGAFALDFSEVESFQSYVEIILVDNFTGTRTNVRNQPSYAFQVTSNPASRGNRRFELIFSDTRVTSITKPTVSGPGLSVWPNPASDAQQVMVGVSGSVTGAATFFVTDAAGRTIATQEVMLSGDANQAYPLSAKLAAGTYTVRCVSATATLATRLVINQ